MTEPRPDSEGTEVDLDDEPKRFIGWSVINADSEDSTFGTYDNPTSAEESAAQMRKHGNNVRVEERYVPDERARLEREVERLRDQVAKQEIAFLGQSATEQWLRAELAASPARWACWFEQCADEADDMPAAERAGLRVAATHLRDESVAERVAAINLGPTAVSLARAIKIAQGAMDDAQRRRARGVADEERIRAALAGEEDDLEVWIPPLTDAVDFGQPPCTHCGERGYHHRSRRCSFCGRRSALVETPGGDRA